MHRAKVPLYPEDNNVTPYTVNNRDVIITLEDNSNDEADNSSHTTSSKLVPPDATTLGESIVRNMVMSYNRYTLYVIAWIRSLMKTFL